MPAPAAMLDPPPDVLRRTLPAAESSSKYRRRESAGAVAAAEGTAPAVERQRVMNVAIVGAPNAGKSQLQLRLSGGTLPVSAVSPKANTTRRSVLAIDTDAESGVQLLFHDTPGYADPRTGGIRGGGGRDRSAGGAGDAGQARRRVARSVAAGAGTTVAGAGVGEGGEGGAVEVALLVVDAARSLVDGGRAQAAMQQLIEVVARAGAPLVLVLNKVDRVKDKRSMVAQAELILGWMREGEREHGVAPVAGMGASLCGGGGVVGGAGGAGVGAASLSALGLLDVYFVSATRDDGVEDLRHGLRVAAHDDRLASCCARPWLFPAGVATDDSLLDRAEELIRERIFDRLHHELPYQVRQVTHGWTEREDGRLRIDHELRVPRESQRNLLLGRKGHAGARPGAAGVNHALAIAAAATPQLEQLLGRRVELVISVKKDSRML
eukprot:g7284.t1